MKKLIIIALIISIFSLSKYSEENEYVVIPDEAIRFRVIANSNNYNDQQIKKEVTKNLTKELLPLINNSQDIKEARKNINSNFDKLSLNVKKTVNGSNYKINYGKNYFPEKTYKGVKYPEGEYESLVIKLGDGAGQNFWCVLFPPLCLLEGTEEEVNKVEYKFLIKDLIKKYF